jgi:transcriptional regulator with XRE-family HTH domain
MPVMPTRERPGDLGATDAREIAAKAAKEIRASRRRLGLSLAAAGRHAGMSGSQLGRIERGDTEHPSLEQLCRAARAVGLQPAFQLYPGELPVRDRGQLALLGRLEKVIGSPLRLRREVVLPLAGDQRAWDARVSDGERTASFEAEARLGDMQDLSRRVARKQRDDPRAGAVILVVNRTAHNRRILAAHREALRDQFPLDGATILRDLRRAKVPPASGILML